MNLPDDDEMAATVVLPENNEDLVSDALRAFLETLAQTYPDDLYGGGLGGEYGYGMEILTPVFEMHPFYEGDCTCGANARSSVWSKQNSHSAECYQAGLARLHLKYPDSYGAHAQALKQAEEVLCASHHIPWNEGIGRAVHCTCGFTDRWADWIVLNGHHARCPVELANFIHIPSGTTVSWYKWIGRDMQVKAPADFDWSACLEECLRSVRTQGRLK
jgi:hypothetical protein